MKEKNNGDVLIVEDADRKTRIVGMKWVKLGDGKDPEFGADVLLYYDAEGGPLYKLGWLKAIEMEINGKEFKFVVDGDQENPQSKFTHYSIPTIPK